MHSRATLLLGVATVVAISSLLFHGCGGTDLTDPDLRASKTSAQLMITGAGTGGGLVTVPRTGNVSRITCAINAGTWSTEQCQRVYPLNTTLTLTASPNQGSTFAGWSGACTGTSQTCRLTMNQARTVQARFVGSTTPTFTINVAGRGSGSGTVTSQSGLTPTINCTITLGAPAASGCSGAYPSGTSVTLTATPASGHTFVGWSTDCSGTGPCTLVVSANRAATAEFTAPPGPEATVGRWDAPTPMSIIGIHSSLLTTGRLLLWGHGGQPQIWNPAGGGFTDAPNPGCVVPNCKVFCAGQTYLADGRLLVAGGHNEALGDGHGVKQASVFDGAAWSPTADMAYRRWYPTLVSLENGDVVAMSGTQDASTWSAVPERYNGAGWISLTSASLEGLPLYPRAFLEPKQGRVFYAGEGASQYLDPSGTGQWTTAGLGNGGDRVVMARNYGSAVMLDSKVLYAGGGGGGGPIDPCPGSSPTPTAEVIDLATSVPTWTATGSMSFSRRQLNLTILPDGKVLASGGTSTCGFSPENGAVFPAEVYDPALGTWSTLASESIIRVYHSTTTLLPDGRIFSSGSGEGGGTSDQFTYQLFSPPYLFKGARPSYNLASTAMHYGQAFDVQTADGASISKVTIIRLGSSTHGFNMGQRLNTLAFQPSPGGLALTPPTSGRIAPPGPYMLFLVNANGVPSVAQTILLSQ